MELENKKLKEENIKLKPHNYNFVNVSGSRDEFRAVTGLTVESFNNVLEFLNPSKFYDTSSRLSQSCDDIESPKFRSKAKIAISRSIVHVYDLVKKLICSFIFSLAF